MKVLLVANINSSHTRKWALALKQRGITLGLFSIDPPLEEPLFASELDLVVFPEKKDRFLPRKYYRLYRSLKRTVQRFRPDVLHSHYLTNYTLLANYIGFKPHVATAWGSDVYAFPKEGPLQKAILRYNLRKTGTLISTSENMAREMRTYVDRSVKIIPFGIDFELFTGQRIHPPLSRERIHIACFKKIEKIYAQDDLILAFQILTQKFPEKNLLLTIAGSGSQLNDIRTMASYLGLSSSIRFTGWVEPSQVPVMLADVDLCVYLSRHESFGVSLLEAMAARVPLVVSATPGFVEVVEDEQRAMIVPVGDPIAAAEKIASLILDPAKAMAMAEKAYQHARSLFELDRNIDAQLDVYSSLHS